MYTGAAPRFCCRPALPCHSRASPADEALGGAQSYAHVVLDISVPQETAFVPRAVHDSFDTSDINVLINK